jgi:hypothetical protein
MDGRSFRSNLEPASSHDCMSAWHFESRHFHQDRDLTQTPLEVERKSAFFKIIFFVVI